MAGSSEKGEGGRRRNPIGDAMSWVARIMAVGIEMVLPGLGGQWLDTRLQTSFLALLGFAIGISFGIWHLLVMTKGQGSRRVHASRPASDSRVGQVDGPE